MSYDLTVDIQSMSYPSSTGQVNTVGKISFAAPAGSFISILGPSGAGKTTLLRIIAGLEGRYEGEVKLGGQLVTRPSRQIQIVFQDHRLLPWRTVAENVNFALPTSDSSVSLSAQWIEKVRLSGKENAWPKDLSGGQEGRVAFARTFVDRPDVLLLDEPFRNLDLVSKLGLQDVLTQALNEQPMVVIMVSHSIDDALVFSDKIHLVSDSPMRIISTFTPVGGKPRERTDDEFRELSEAITLDLLKLRNKETSTI